MIITFQVKNQYNYKLLYHFSSFYFEYMEKLKLRIITLNFPKYNYRSENSM